MSTLDRAAFEKIMGDTTMPNCNGPDFDEWLFNKAWEARQTEIDALKLGRTVAQRLEHNAKREIERLMAEVEGFRKDADRLDFIENSHLYISDREEGFVINHVTGYPNDREWHQVGEGETIREAIDAAMGNKGKRV